jgi:gas vesicle protein
MKSGKLILGLIAGILIGVVAGILLAPDKGSRTRRKLMDKGEDYLDDMKEKYNDMTDSIVKKYEKTFQQAEEAVSSIKS